MKNYFIGKMIYPIPWMEVNPPGYPLTEKILTVSENIQIIGWLDTTFPEKDPFFIYFHGNGENLATLDLSGFFSKLRGLKVNSFVIDYPGYGRSSGKPSEETILESANQAILWVSKNFPEHKIVVCGWSLGAAVAVQAVAKNSEAIDRLILLSPWSSLQEVAGDHFPQFLVKWMLHEKYHSLEAVKSIQKPVLVIHGLNDQIIPIHHSRNLVKGFSIPPLFFEISDVGHNDLLDKAIVWHEMMNFIYHR